MVTPNYVVENEYLTQRIRCLEKIINAHEEADAIINAPQQTKLESRIEVTVNYVSGFILAWATMVWFVTPLVNYGIIMWNNAFIITSIFTTVSILRSYCWRRFFAREFHIVVHTFIKRYLTFKF